MFKTAAVFSDNMVLQREKNVRIFGTGDNGTVTVSVMGNSAAAEIIDGKWTATLPPMKAADDLEVTVTDGTDTIIFRNVCIGEVWLAGGQSNMERELKDSKDGDKYLSQMTADMPVRFYYTNKMNTVEKAVEAEKYAGWGVCDPEGSKAWSAVGFHFAMKLAKQLGVTVGIIGCNWGGTSASAWINEKYLSNDKELNSYLEDYEAKKEGRSDEELVAAYEEYLVREAEFNEKSAKLYEKDPDISWDEVQRICGQCEWPGPMGPANPYRPCGLYETMLMRVCPYTLRGFTYYQGESDDHKPALYAKLLASLIDCWRTDWQDDKLPFLLVQLPMFKYKSDPDYKHWCLIREAQMKVFNTVKNTGIAVITDCGELDNIHPFDKLPVGERLALQAMKLVYGIDCQAFGPLFRSVYFSENKAELTFDHAEQGFEIRGEAVTGFEMAGSDKDFKEATAEIAGEKIILHADVKYPAYVRYDWYNWIEPSVFGAKTGIPLAPFRTSANDDR